MRNFKYTWEEFHSLPFKEKKAHLIREDNLAYLLFAKQFDKKNLEQLFKIADKIRNIAKVKSGSDWLQTVLSDKRALLYFSQPSTRTFMSFQSSCHILGIKVSELRAGTTSSEQKGESPEDTINTFAAYSDLLIIRNANQTIAEKASWLLNKKNRIIKVINAGSGKDEHPTQALLDIYTLDIAFRDKGGIEGRTITVAGDLKRGRAARSLIYILKNFNDVKFNFVSPDLLKIEDDVRDFLKKNKIQYTEANNLESALQSSDVIYMTRLQDEYDVNNESKSLNYSDFHLKKHHLKLLKKDAIIMHPLPRRDEVDVEIDEDKRAIYWQQERNGMWIRAALIAYMFGIGENILNYK